MGSRDNYDDSIKIEFLKNSVMLRLYREMTAKLVATRNINLECGSIYQFVAVTITVCGRRSVDDEVAGRECHKHHVKDVRFINRWLLFRVKPALGLVPLGGASSSLSLSLSIFFSFFLVVVGRCYACISTVYTRVD